jgi:hypothetical protein
MALSATLIGFLVVFSLYPALGFGQSLPLPPPRAPIAGTGSGGAYGPVVANASERPSTTSNSSNTVVPPPRITASTRAPAPPDSPVQVHSNDATYLDLPSNSPASPDETVDSSFTVTTGAIDLGGATDGNYIVTTDQLGNMSIYTMAGSLVESTSLTTIACPGLPLCGNQGGYAGDARIIYDYGSQRWIVSALWIAGPAPVQDLFIVSATNNPTGNWLAYQFPACGSFDTWDGSDQPHLGFNNRWIVITSACSCQSSTNSSTNGAGLAVFDKSNLYKGGSLTLNSNWFEFVDGYSGGPYCNLSGSSAVNSRDTPVRTYTTTTDNREYLVTAYYNTTTGNAEVVYGHLQGGTDSPVFYSPTETVTTSFATNGSAGADFLPAVFTPDTPGGCPTEPPLCMTSFANGWIQSAGVWRLNNGHPFILSTQTAEATQYSNETQIISVATDTYTGAATALSLAGGEQGSGPMGSEIGMPLVSGGVDEAVVGYDMSRSDFIPGVKDFEWDIDNNSVVSVNTLKPGFDTPQFSNCAGQGRWLDLLDALQPIPNSGNLLLGGTFGYVNDGSECSSYWATITR